MAPSRKALRRERVARSTETDSMRPEEDPNAQLAKVRAAAEKQAAKHRRLIKTARGGARLSAAMLPFAMIRSPAGYGVLTTIGRKTARARRKVIRVIRKGNKAYLVQLRPPEIARTDPSAVAAWVRNIRANPNVRLRIRGRTFRGVARELKEPGELAPAREAICETVHLTD